MQEPGRGEAVSGVAGVTKKILTGRSRPRQAQPTGLDQGIARAMLAATGRPQIAIVLWNGEEVSLSGASPVARLRVHDRATLWSLLRNPELQFGEAYSAGRIEVEGNLLDLLETIYRSRAQITPQSLGHRLLGSLYQSPRPRTNTLARSRRNIHHHYDLGNDFYALWLDRRMLYTCAYYADESMSLEDAQVAKMDHVCRKLRLQPGEHVVEAGCGWGGFALHMARHYGVRVSSFNISGEQLDYARERARAENLSDRVEFLEGDYREIRGDYDAFASIGMLEHVGTDHYRDLGRVIARSLLPNGRGLIHSIGRDRSANMNAWIERRIFPGAYPPSLKEMMEIFDSAHLSVLDVENLRLHYVRTISHWLDRFEAAEATIDEWFGPAFVRAWRLYLTGSIAAFSTGQLQLFQVAFARSGSNAIPWTRAHLYT